jgi:hypothetical protein
MARAETITRVVCTVLGSALACCALAFFLGVGMHYAWDAGVVGGFFIGVAAVVLLRRGLSGRDVDRFDTGAARDYNLRYW